MSRYSKVATSPIPPHTFVYIDPTNPGQAIQAIDGIRPLFGVTGIGQRDFPWANAQDGFGAVGNENVEIYGYPEVEVLLKVGSVPVACGDLLTSDANGNAITATSGYIGAQALEIGGVGEIISVKLFPSGTSSGVPQNGLVAWLVPATGGSGAQFTDLTGNTSPWTQPTSTERPTYNVLGANGVQPAIHFAGNPVSGLGQRLNGGNVLTTLTGSHTIIFVFQSNDFQTDSYYLRMTSGSASRPVVLQDNGQLRTHPQLAGLPSIMNRFNVATFRATQTTPPNTFNESMRQDGVTTWTISGTTADAFDNTGSWYVGGDTTSYGTISDIAAVLIYNRALFDSEVAQIEVWANSLYALYGANPPSFNFVFDGNSISTGQPTGVNPGYIQCGMVTYNPCPGYVSYSYGGKSGLTTIDATWVKPATTNNIYSGWEYTNENINGTASVTLAEYEAYFLAAKNAGFNKVIAWTAMPSSSITEANRTAYNTLLKSKFSGTPTLPGSGVYPVLTGQSNADFLVDMGSDAIMGVATSWTTNPLYWFNTIHPGQLGHWARMSPYFLYSMLAAVPSAWNPLAAQPTGWWRADIGRYQDSGFTTLAQADGDPVGAWVDFSGNENHLLQATGGNRATLKLGIQNGLPAVRFNGTSGSLATTNTWNYPTTVVGVCRIVSFVGGANDVLESAGSQWQTSASSPYWNCFTTGSVNNTTAPLGTGVANRMSGVMNNTTCFGRLNGVQVLSGNTGPGTLGAFTIGAKTTGTGSYANVDWLELFMWNSVVSTPVIQQYEAYLQAKWASN